VKIRQSGQRTETTTLDSLADDRRLQETVCQTAAGRPKLQTHSWMNYELSRRLVHKVRFTVGCEWQAVRQCPRKDAEDQLTVHDMSHGPLYYTTSTGVHAWGYWRHKTDHNFYYRSLTERPEPNSAVRTLKLISFCADIGALRFVGPGTYQMYHAPMQTVTPLLSLVSWCVKPCAVRSYRVVWIGFLFYNNSL